MIHEMLLPAEFWTEVESAVSANVDEALNTGKHQRDVIISYLRDLEIMARTACDRRQTIQIIASARSILGDRTPLGPDDGPFAYAPA